ncbi:MAG: hypothetical protein IJU70_06820 [Lentisphaeria bacterium]|nr:hypothetical protein [Lentisphaeria bacterium]
MSAPGSVFAVLILLLPFFPAFSEDPVMMDLNFDDTPEQIVSRLYPADFLGRQLNPKLESKIIQTRIKTKRFPGRLYGYKFLVRNGKLCFISGKPLPDKFPASPHGELTQEIIAFDRDAAGAEYAKLLKERKLIERQFSATGIPCDRAAAYRFYLDGSQENPQGYRELKILADQVDKKMPKELPVRFPDAKSRDRQTKCLASIADDWKKIESMLGDLSQRKAVWDLGKGLFNQPLSLNLYRTMARVFQMRMQAKADAGDVPGALADFERSRVLLNTDGPVIAGLVSVAVESYRLNGLGNILFRGKLTQEQLRKLDDGLQKDEEFLRRTWRRAWYLESAWGLDTISMFIDGTADPSLSILRTPEGHVLFLFAVPWTREWIFAAQQYRKILSESVSMENYRKVSSLNHFPDGFVLCPAFIGQDVDQANIRHFYGIAMIRAARSALRHLGLREKETPLDPFTGKPFQVLKGKFMEKGRKVRGIRFYSAGPDGRYADGMYLHPYNRCDDTAFDLIEEVEP